MSSKFCCVECGHRLKAYPRQAGEHCKCPRCGHVVSVPAPPPLPVTPAGAPAASPGCRVLRKSRLRLALGVVAAVAVLAAGVVLGVVLYARAHLVDQKLTDLRGDV